MQTRMRHDGTGLRRARSGRRAGFTMIELLVVISILVILAGIAVVLAGRVTGSGKRTQTEATIRALDQILTEYKTEQGARPPSIFKDDDDNEFPMIDARGTGADPDSEPESSLGFFLLEASRRVGSIDEMLKGIDPQLVVRVPKRSAVEGPITLGDVETNELVTVLDGWGKPIRFVHPSFDGGAGTFYTASGQGNAPGRPSSISVRLDNGATLLYRRSFRPFDPGSAESSFVGDADEGICPGKSPYFYSSGDDEDPGTRGDNIYTVEPQFPTETADLK